MDRRTDRRNCDSSGSVWRVRCVPKIYKNALKRKIYKIRQIKDSFLSFGCQHRYVPVRSKSCKASSPKRLRNDLSMRHFDSKTTYYVSSGRTYSHTTVQVKSYAQRASACPHLLSRQLLTIMDQKKTNLAFAADVTTCRELLDVSDITVTELLSGSFFLRCLLGTGSYV